MQLRDEQGASPRRPEGRVFGLGRIPLAGSVREWFDGAKKKSVRGPEACVSDAGKYGKNQGGQAWYRLEKVGGIAGILGLDSIHGLPLRCRPCEFASASMTLCRAPMIDDPRRR